MISIFRSLFAPPRHLILPLAALWLGLAASEKRAEQYGMAKDALNNIVFSGAVGYVVGGRVLFALANLPAFRADPLGIFSINIDLFDPVGALITAVIVGIVSGQRQKLLFWSTLDALTPLFATLAIGLSLAHLAAGTAFGKPTSLPWGMELWNATRHPSQLYELIGALFIFGWIWLRRAHEVAGSSFLTFVALTAGARLLLEAFRGDSILIFGGLRLAQIIAWIVLAIAWVAAESMRTDRNAD